MAANSWDDNPTDAWDDAQEGVPTSQAPSQSARVSSVSSVSSSTGTPVGKAALASGAPAGDPEGWDAFDDEDDEDEGGGPGTPGSGTGSGAGGAKALALTKEEKRAELARKREERRVVSWRLCSGLFLCPLKL